MPKLKCLVCGKKTKGVRMKHGLMPVCESNGYCWNQVCLKSFDSVPVVWVGKEDFIEKDILTEEEMKERDFDVESAADYACEELWNMNLSDIFNTALKIAATLSEQDWINNTKAEDLPLLINRIKDGQNKRILEDRLKKGT